MIYPVHIYPESSGDQVKKFFVYFLIFSFLNLVGCYYQEQMNPSDYKFDENNKIEITTKDTSYIFNSKDYYLRNDTLIGQQSRLIKDRAKEFYDISIPVEDINSVEVEKQNSEGTLLIVLAIVVSIITVVAIVELNDLGLSN